MSWFRFKKNGPELNDRARQALQAAEIEAEALGDSRAGARHLLYALASASYFKPVQHYLTDHALTPENVENEVLRHRVGDSTPASELRSLETEARAEAMRLGDGTVNPMHLLFALINCDDGLNAVFHAHGIRDAHEVARLIAQAHAPHIGGGR